MRKKSVSGRIRFIYEEEGSSVENEFNWTRGKAEEVLLNMVYDDLNKTGDKLNAIKELNKMRGIDVPVVKVEKSGDDVDAFFSKVVGDNVEE